MNFCRIKNGFLGCACLELMRVDFRILSHFCRISFTFSSLAKPNTNVLFPLYNKSCDYKIKSSSNENPEF